MSTAKLIAEIRNEHGRGASRRLRHAGKIPAIIYGGGKDAIAVTLDHNTIYYALKKEDFHTSVLDLEVGEQKEKVVVRDFHMHAFRQAVLHVDFQRVSATDEIHIKVPLHFLNEEISPAVKTQGAHVTHVTTEVEVRALASKLPHFIEIDLANLNAGQTIHLSDLVLPEGVKLEKLLRGDDAAVVIAAGITEAAEAEIVSPADVPAAKGDASAAE